jgi:hypothetical protein
MITVINFTAADWLFHEFLKIADVSVFYRMILESLTNAVFFYTSDDGVTTTPPPPQLHFRNLLFLWGVGRKNRYVTLHMMCFKTVLYFGT